MEPGHELKRPPARLVVITAAYPSPAEPMRAVFLKNYLQALAAESFEIAVVAPRVHREDPLEEIEGPIAIRRFRYPSGGRRLKELGRLPALSLPVYLLAGLSALVLEVRRRAPALLYAHWVIPAGFLGALAAALCGLPLVVHAHGSDIHRYALSSRPAAALARWTLRRATLILAVSQDLARQMAGGLGIPAEKIRILPMGIDGRWFRPAEDRERRRRELEIDEGRLHLLFAGDLDPWKGIDFLAAALAAAKDLVGKVCLHIAGAGALRPELERLEKCSRGAVRLLGRLPPEELASWYHAADLLVLPSRGEGAPVSVMEALACGLPVLATPAGGIPELVEDGKTGWLAASPEFLDRIRDLLRRPELLLTARKRLLEKREDRGVGRRAREAEPLLRAVLSGPAGKEAFR
ncbi:MAG: glycosyltransferase [Planctomycetes bacterium]|nr:glycosyltransferase [Planctomycetota bacterium]